MKNKIVEHKDKLKENKDNRIRHLQQNRTTNKKNNSRQAKHINLYSTTCANVQHQMC